MPTEPTLAQQRAATVRRRAYAKKMRAAIQDDMQKLIDDTYALEQQNPYWGHIDTDSGYELTELPELEQPREITRKGPPPNQIRLDEEPPDEDEDDEDDDTDEDEKDLQADPPYVLLTPADQQRLLKTLDPGWTLSRKGLTRKFDLPNRRACADFLAALMEDANRKNHHPDLHVADCVITVTYVTHAAGNKVTEYDFDCAAAADQLARTTPEMALHEVISLPDISDVKHPSMIGAIPPKKKPKKKPKRKRVNYHGVMLSRAPMKFEAKVLSLTEIPPRLDAAVEALEQPDMLVFNTLSDIARFGAMQALLELVRQGAPRTILAEPPDCDDAVRALSTTVEGQRYFDLTATRQEFEAKLSQRRINQRRRADLIQELADRRAPGIFRRYAKRAVNEAFALGRAAVVAKYRRPRVDLASKFDKLESGEIWVDAVIQTAVMDTNTCEECEEVDGEVMELGDERQQELHPPYVKCLGGDRCRCVQIALLSDGTQIDVDEVEDLEDTLD